MSDRKYSNTYCIHYPIVPSCAAAVPHVKQLDVAQFIIMFISMMCTTALHRCVDVGECVESCEFPKQKQTWSHGCVWITYFEKWTEKLRVITQGNRVRQVFFVFYIKLKNIWQSVISFHFLDGSYNLLQMYISYLMKMCELPCHTFTTLHGAMWTWGRPSLFCDCCTFSFRLHLVLQSKYTDREKLCSPVSPPPPTHPPPACHWPYLMLWH